MSEREIFEAALDHAPAERPGFLDGACGGDAGLRKRVDALLARHADAGSFLEKPAVAAEFTVAYRPITEGPGTIIGPYKLLQQIGEGGFGTVFMAEQERPLRRMVALKIIKPGMDTAQVIARFESERQALALMDHPNIAKVLDAGATESGRPYFVMELVKGVPITEFCDRNHMPAEERLKLFIVVCHAIQHSHHKGVIHRDIKPSNVMVTLHDGVPVVKVIDFGVAKAMVQRLTERTLFTSYGQMIGTPAYMSPEQAEMSGLDIDTRSDVYSLGVLLYELLTGTTPLDVKQLRDAGYVEMQRLIREQEAPRPSTRLSSLGDSATVQAGNRGLDVKRLAQLLAGDLDWIAMKALDKDRNRRYETPGNFAEDIQRYLQRDAILARPPSTVYKIKKFVQRNRAAALSAATIATLLLVGIAGTTYGLLRAEERRRDAELARNAESVQRKRVTDEQVKTQQALEQSQSSEAKAVEAQRSALRQAANSACDVAQQLCERSSVAQGLVEYSHALIFAHEAKDSDLEEAIRWNIGTWWNEMHPLAYTIKTANWRGSMGAFHPAGKILAVGGQAPKEGSVVIRLYNAVDGTPRGESLVIEGPSALFRLAWEPGGERLGIYTEDGRVHIWKPGQPVPTISFPADLGGKYFDAVTFPDMAFSPDGSRLIVGTSRPFAKVFDTTSGQAVDMDLSGGGNHPPGHWTTAVDWSRDGTQLLTGSEIGVTKIWDAKTGKFIREIVTCECGLKALRFSPDKKMFVCASGFGVPKLQVWNSESGQPVGPPMHHIDNLYDVDFSPDGRLIIAVDSSCEAFVWEVGSSRMVGAPIWTGAHSTAAAFHPSGQLMMTVNLTDIHVWKLGSGMQRSEVAYVDPEEARLAPYAKKYEAEVSPRFETNNAAFVRREMALCPDGACLLKFNPRVGPIEMIDAKTFRVLHVLPKTESTERVYWRPDSREFVAAAFGKTWIRDGVTGEPKAEIWNCEPFSGAFRPDSARFAIATADYRLRFFDTATWKPIGPTLPHTSGVMHSAFSRDGKLVFTADRALTTRLWHASTGKRIGPVLSGYWPRVCADNETFVIGDGRQIKGYRIPTPINGDVDEVFHRVEMLTNQQGAVVAIDETRDTSPMGPMGPEEALRSVGKFVWDGWRAPTTALRKGGFKFSLSRLPDGKSSLKVENQPLSDLSFLKDAPIEELWIGGTRVSDLRPLENLPLIHLDIWQTPVSDLSPLRAPVLSASLRELNAWRIPATDFSPIAACTNLEWFDAANTALADLEVVRGRKLRGVLLSDTKITDISVLAGMPVERVTLSGTAVTDLRPLLQCPTLTELVLPRGARDVGALRALPRLARLSYGLLPGGFSKQTAKEFWLEYEHDGITAEEVSVLSEQSVKAPQDSLLAMKVAALDAWFGLDTDYAATCKRMIETAERADKTEDVRERAAKNWCLRPSNDAAMLPRVLALAREAARAELKVDQRPWYQQALGMAEFRAGHDEAAEAAFLKAEQASETGDWHPDWRPFIQGPSRFFRAIMLFRQGKEQAAKTLFQEAETQMPPIPENAAHALPAEVTQDQLLCWLTYKEAKALLKIGPATKP